MSNLQSEFFVVGITHVDLAWKRGRAEMSEMMEIVVLRLLDALERDPGYRYHIEQSAHFRQIQKRRPDLIDRLRPYVQEGRIEMAGGMASTLEANLPNGECFIRNQQIGLQWVRDTWGVDVKTGWLVDTFGIPAQVSQILKGFGIHQLMASRFGGNHTHDLFLAHGLDGSQITVTGWNTNAAYTRPENVAWRFYQNWDGIESCFAKADKLTGPGPFLVLPYTENEYLVSLRPQEIIAERNRERPHQVWRTATPADFFDAVAKTGRALPVVDGDLNPEFTGCFSLRHNIRLRNRKVETRLLEAEKWAALTDQDRRATLEDAWWEIAYAQFHDVFTGSHPTVVYEDLMRVFDEIETAADVVLTDAFAQIAPQMSGSGAETKSASATVFNGLPWDRSDIAEIPLPTRWAGIAGVTDAKGAALPFAVDSGTVRVLADVPATGHATLTLEADDVRENATETADTATLENEWIRAEFDMVSGIAKLVWKPTDKILMENAGSFLLAQRDDGNFQIENPSGPEVAAASGTLHLEKTTTSLLGQTLRLSGEFPTLGWAGPQSHLGWAAEFFLPVHSPVLRLSLHLDWKGESSRLRLTLPTKIDSSTGIFEVPFGVVSRKPYMPRGNAKGEWPVHRFVAVQDSQHGIALINTGVGGVEVSGGTIYTTLLRAPRAEYVGMVADATSSQHGEHDYHFAIAPYAGSWSDAGVVQAAQEVNNPLLTVVRPGGGSGPVSASLLRLEPVSVVLSGIKAASDGSGDLIVRVYETVGTESKATLTVPGVDSAVSCNLREQEGDSIPMSGDNRLRITLQPFEIKTLRIKRSIGKETK